MAFARVKASIFPERTPVFAAAPTQRVIDGLINGFAGRNSPPAYPIDEKRGFATDGDEKSISVSEGEFQSVQLHGGHPTCPTCLQKVSLSAPEDVKSIRKPNAFDKITKLAGSSGVFFFVMGLIGVWVLFGILYGTTDNWQIVMQNVSSIQVYVTDILLIRQQQNASRGLMTTLAELQSRNKTCERLLSQIPGCQWMETHTDEPRKLANGQPLSADVETSLFMVNGKPSRWQKIWTASCHFVATTLGSIWAFVIYWIGIGVWIAIGPLFGFSDEWQLYINTATAVALTFTSVFLQNIQQQQEDTLERCLDYALKVDAEVEYKLRELTEDSKPNPIIEIPAPTPTRTERSIDRFAEVMGSGLGVAISLAAVIAWVAVGPLLQFGPNWLLIIGTFTGLIGFIDGFVLRNLYHRDEKYTEGHFRSLELSDSQLLDRLNVPVPVRPNPKRSLATRISIVTGDGCGHKFTTVGSVVVVILLLVAATILKWSETGQLLCNTPTMIVEGFLLLVLIQAHNIANEERGHDFNGILKRRLLLNSYVHAIS